MKIGVIGAGVVGRATARCWMEWGEVRVHDADPARSTHTFLEAAECDVVFLCLPTPAGPDRMAAVEAVCERLPCLSGVIALRSTVPVGTTRSLARRFGLTNLVHYPEFLTARCAAVDAQTPARNVLGGHEEGVGTRRLSAMLGRRFPGVPLLCMSSDESEAVKLATNAFFAVKMAYFNELHSFCEAANLDWDSVLAGVLADGRIAHSHTRVPGPDGRAGFGGECIPKDADCFAHCADVAGVGATLVRAALRRNQGDRLREVRP